MAIHSYSEFMKELSMLPTCLSLSQSRCVSPLRWSRTLFTPTIPDHRPLTSPPHAIPPLCPLAVIKLRTVSPSVPPFSLFCQIRRSQPSSAQRSSRLQGRASSACRKFWLRPSPTSRLWLWIPTNTTAPAASQEQGQTAAHE